VKYLASPYSHSDPFVREERYLRAMQVLKGLLEKRMWTFSPIVHCHELKKIADLPHEHEFWLDYDCHILKQCDELLVLRIEGWETSRGVKMEMDFAKANSIPISFL
jgi:hypothetical protein